MGEVWRAGRLAEEGRARRPRQSPRDPAHVDRQLNN
ncbi:hypothetical protein RR48_04226 [Papilio machaon]|uniref:Uncharacterized protein n=1 Tax=Papilio machaon TaxID=76193 RepID=A0A0N0PBL5_PAPMA|nr:hypothetical protein RR48_04226 [Papilio machaon]